MIKIQNIYYMLSYAYQVLRAQGYEKCVNEEFKNTADLLASILCKAVSVQIKRGLGREYRETNDVLSGPKGKILLSESLKQNTLMNHKVICEYDEFSVDSNLNRILKITMLVLLHSDISIQNKKEIRRLLLYFDGITEIKPSQINWLQRFNKNNKTYEMMVNVCYLVLKGVLQTDIAGNIKLQKYIDEQRMSRLYEKFILEYFRKEHKELKVSASQIPWALDDGINTMLPVMQSDIMLEKNNKILIIDAKYYSHATQVKFDNPKIHSGNLYQIFTYVKNMDYNFNDKEHDVAGMLLYAKTDEKILPDNDYSMSGNKISVKTLDLNTDFIQIAHTLDDIVTTYFDTI